MKRIITALLAIAMLLSACALAEGTFRVGMECDYPPFNWTQVDENENTVPIEVEVYQYEVLADDGASEETETHTSLTAYLPHTMKDQVDVGMTVRIGREKGTIVWIGTQADGTNVVDIIFLSAMTMISPYCPL